MIYRALVDLAGREDLLQDTSYEPKPVHYLLALSRTGELLSILEPRDPPRLDRKGRPVGRLQATKRPVPRRSDRTGTRPPAEFLVDKAEYVFGIDPSGKAKPERLAERRRLFQAYVAEAAKAVPQSAGLRAVTAFLQRDPPDTVRSLLAAEKEAEQVALSGALFAFVYQPDGGTGCVHDEPAVKAFFATRLSALEDDLIGQCLVTGRKGALLTRLHAKPKGIPPKGKTKGGVPLTSVNADAFKSYGLDAIGCAPISREANVAVELALNRLLDPAYPRPSSGDTFPQRNIQISPDTVVLYWTRDEAALDFMQAIDAVDPEEVGRLLRSPFKAFTAPIDDPTAFYALILSGTTGRAIVRSFLESTVRDVAKNVDAYRQDAMIARPFSAPPGGFSLQDVRRSLVARGDLELLPPALGTQLYLRVLDGRPFPREVLDAAVRRNRAGDIEVSRMAPRCSLLKAFFNRNMKKELPVSLDRLRPDPPYRLGRLLAVVDKVQQESQRSEETQDRARELNATLTDRFFSSASSTPAAVFPTLLRRHQTHMGKLRREKPGLAIVREKLVQEIVSKIDAFPPTMGLEDQGLFALGYYHQRQALFTRNEEE